MFLTIDVSNGSSFGRLSSTDPDKAANCLLQYVIQPESSAKKFAVSNNGNISTIASLDREEHALYVFYVTVKDCGQPPLTDSVRVTVTVKDVNDNIPQFPGPYNVDISEGESSGSTVVQVKATGKLVVVFRYKYYRNTGHGEAFVKCVILQISIPQYYFPFIGGKPVHFYTPLIEILV